MIIKIQKEIESRMGKFLALIIIFVLGSKFAAAQQNTIEHSIQKGETVYSISKTYGVNMNAIFALNPESEDIIYAGRILLIPETRSSNTSSETSATITNSQISNYLVKRGETKSGLSRRFGVSIALLEQQNPHTIAMLQAGHIINLDKTIAEKKPLAREGEHIVVKGETLWGIAKRNDITVAQLTATNKGKLTEFLQIGQILTIPEKSLELQDPNMYLVRRGDTKFYLAKQFNMSIAMLEEKNPHIVNMLMAGHKLNISNTDEADAKEEEKLDTLTEVGATETEIPSEVEVSQVDTTQTAADPSSYYKDYVIEPKETLYSLSKKAGMTMVAFTELNPKLRNGVNKGDIIKMPIDPSKIPANINKDVRKDLVDIKVKTINKNADLYANLETLTTKGLYFYTPFSGEELSSPELRQKLLSENATYEKYLEFLQGAQIAIDSALSLNLNFDISLIKSSDSKSRLKIESAYKKNAILVPFLENSSSSPKVISDETLSVIDIESNLGPIKNSTVYKAIPSENLQKTKTLNYLASKNENVLVVSDLKVSRDKDMITTAIPNAQFLTVDKAGFFEESALENALSRNKTNYVILDSEKTIVFLNSTTSLMSKLSDYKINLVIMNNALFPKKSEVSDMRFRVLKLIFPAVIENAETKSRKNFASNYTKLFNTNPTDFAILGFDVTLDVLLRLSQNSSFEESITKNKSEHSHTKFIYNKTNDETYINTAINIMQYDSNAGVNKLD